MSMSILPNIPGSQCLRITDDGDRTIIFYFRRIVPTVACPGCGSLSNHVQSGYHRTVRDVAVRGWQVRMEIDVRRFDCRNPACDYAIFCERLLPWVPAYGRRSHDLTEWITQWGWHLSAESLARIALQQGVQVSAPTILRVLRAESDPVWETPRVVGIDDWARRKGHTYATVVVDLERHRIVDVLPDRQPETVSQWLIRHPGIEVVSRDRAKGYGKAINDGAPTAQQIADRWHLLENLSDALNDVFTREPPRLKPLAPAPRDPGADGTNPTLAGVVHQQERYATIRALADAGCRVAEIARRTGYDRKTITKYLAAAEPPAARSRAPYPHLLDAFVPRLEQLWMAGTRNSKDVWAALQAVGYTGSRATVSRWLRARRQRDQAPAGPRRIARRTWVAWFMVPTEEWPRWATAALSALLAAAPLYRRLWTLVHQFHTLLTHRQGHALGPWIQAAEASGIPEIARFARGLRDDFAAVQAGLTEEWSQGMTEGFNNQIKCLKRVMYGRADFDLLRARILHNQS